MTVCIVAIAGIFFSGCASKRKALEQELAQRDQTILELEGDNEELRTQLVEEDVVVAEGETVLQDSRDMLMVALQGTGAGVETRGVNLVVSLPSVMLFGPGKYKLKKGAKGPLSKIARVIRDNFPTATIRVEGYTDNQPIKKLKDKFESNWELSAARAASVLHYLVDKGHIEPQNIYLAGFGEYHPIDSNATAAGRKKNRRVGIVVLTEGG
ncbi:MAG: flagellar motor protein MotB [Candidatus Brocadiales bacterium]